MTSEYGFLDHFDTRLQIVDLPYDQFHTSADRVGQFSARGILCESMELRNAPNTLRSNQAKLGELAIRRSPPA